MATNSVEEVKDAISVFFHSAFISVPFCWANNSGERMDLEVVFDVDGEVVDWVTTVCWVTWVHRVC